MLLFRKESVDAAHITLFLFLLTLFIYFNIYGIISQPYIKTASDLQRGSSNFRGKKEQQQQNVFSHYKKISQFNLLVLT